jgi:hypothetical protein
MVSVTTLVQGKRESFRKDANHPGSTQMNSGVHPNHFSALSLQGSVSSGCLFNGSESKREDDHQKYRLVMR